MKEEHETRITALAEKLADRFLQTAEPDRMSGGDKELADLTKEERGNLAWDLKAANGFGLLLARALELRTRMRWQRQAEQGGDAPEPANNGLPHPLDTDEEIKRFEGAAVAALQRAKQRAT